MKQRFRIYRRGTGNFYCQDNETGKQESLGTENEATARRLLQARNQTQSQPELNREIGLAYLKAADPEGAARTWRHVMEAVVRTKQGPTLHRWLTATKDPAFRSILEKPLFQTRAEHFLQVLHAGGVSTNVFLRRLHNFALDMDWLARSVIVRRQWPQVRYRRKRAITFEEHARIVEREGNPERRAFYQLAWHLGASQSDLANLQAGDVNWKEQLVCFTRRKTGQSVRLRFGLDAAKVLRGLPSTGPLFPYLQAVREADRATEFRQRCDGLGIYGVSLHSYRFSWAERARAAGMPERFAMEALGHDSRAVHHAYARHAHTRVPSLEDYERRHEAAAVIDFPLAASPAEWNAVGGVH
jgi:hypothetical protein